MAENEFGGRASALRIAAWAGLPALLLLIPLITGMDWGPEDFTFMGVLLVGAGLVYALATISVKRAVARGLIGLAVLAVVVFVWADAAVGVIGIFNGS